MARSLPEIAAALEGLNASQELLVAVAIVHGFELLADELRGVAHGDSDAPGGLEAVTVGIAGPSLRDSLTKAIRAHGQSFQSLADAVEKIHQTIAKEWP